MKLLLITAGLIMIGLACGRPLPVTGNPDKLTTNSGTAGSSKMSTTLPGQRGTGGQTTDTNKIGLPVIIDSTRPGKDSIPR